MEKSDAVAGGGAVRLKTVDAGAAMYGHLQKLRAVSSATSPVDTWKFQECDSVR